STRPSTRHAKSTSTPTEHRRPHERHRHARRPVAHGIRRWTDRPEKRSAGAFRHPPGGRESFRLGRGLGRRPTPPGPPQQPLQAKRERMTNLTKLASDIFEANKAKGFWD